MDKEYKKDLDKLFKDYKIPYKEIVNNQYFDIRFEVGVMGTIEYSFLDSKHHNFTNKISLMKDIKDLKQCKYNKSLIYTDKEDIEYYIYTENKIPNHVKEAIAMFQGYEKLKWLKNYKIIEYTEDHMCGSSGYGNLVFQKLSDPKDIIIVEKVVYVEKCSRCDKEREESKILENDDIDYYSTEEF